MKGIAQMIATAHTITLAAMLDEDGQRWVKSRYKDVHAEIDQRDRERKVEKAKARLAIQTATADVFGDTHAEQTAKAKAERSIQRTARWSVPLEDLDIDQILAEMPELYQQYRTHQAEENRRWNPGQKDAGSRYNPNWFAESRKAAQKAQREFERELAYAEKVAKMEEAESAKAAEAATVAAIQPSLF